DLLELLCLTGEAGHILEKFGVPLRLTNTHQFQISPSADVAILGGNRCGTLPSLIAKHDLAGSEIGRRCKLLLSSGETLTLGLKLFGLWLSGCCRRLCGFLLLCSLVPGSFLEAILISLDNLNRGLIASGLELSFP